MWMHIDSIDYAAAKSGIAVSDTPVGPFTYIESFRLNAGVWSMNVTEDEKTSGIVLRDFEKGQISEELRLRVF